MRVLLFSSWSINEGTARGTLFPLIEMMEKNQAIDRIYFCTVEPNDFKEAPIHLEKTVHIPLRSGVIPMVDKVWNLIRLPMLLKNIVQRNAIDLIWCKGAPAGGVGTFVHFLTGSPYVIDSFEPHSEYMVQSGTWSEMNPKFLVQQWLEALTLKHAPALLPVSQKYYALLVKRGIERERLFVFPCVINLQQFAFNAHARKIKRNALHIKNTGIVGIYVGKYGGLYYDHEAFLLYRHLFRFFGSEFFLIIITESNPKKLQTKIEEHQLPADHCFISKASHREIGDFLSAADFAISTIKSVPAMGYCSPIKHGEYWAADLPILSTLDVGDDAEIMRDEGGGVVLDVQDHEPDKKLAELKSMIGNRGSGLYSKFAFKYRHPSIMADAIEFVLNKFVSKKEAAD